MKSARENGGFSIFCDSCGSRAVWLRGDCLIIKRKHHGQSHVTVLPLEDLLKLIETRQIRSVVRSAS